MLKKIILLMPFFCLQLISCSNKIKAFEKYKLLNLSFNLKKVNPNSDLFIKALVNSKKTSPIVKSKYKIKATLLNLETNDTLTLTIYGKRFFYFNSEMYESELPLFDDSDYNFLTSSSPSN